VGKGYRIEVGRTYGQIAFTLTPLLPTSFAALRVSPMTACLLAVYAALFALSEALLSALSPPSPSLHATFGNE
jgi:hypothetical protein